jgi:hypothetical protein
MKNQINTIEKFVSEVSLVNWMVQVLDLFEKTTDSVLVELVGLPDCHFNGHLEDDLIHRLIHGEFNIRKL